MYKFKLEIRNSFPIKKGRFGKALHRNRGI